MPDHTEIALITGASGGIGKELAILFAEKRISILLVARNESALKSLAAYLEKDYGIVTYVYAADLSNIINVYDLENYCNTNRLFVKYLVNNAGFGDFHFFADSNMQKMTEMMNLNMVALTTLCRLFVPKMVRQKTGYVLNIASLAAFNPGPFMAVYFASKAYVLSLSEAINYELKNSGVSVTAFCPGGVETNFQKAANLGSSPMLEKTSMLQAKPTAKAAFNAMMERKAVKVYSFSHYLMALLVRFVPRNFAVAVASKIIGKKK